MKEQSLDIFYSLLYKHVSRIVGNFSINYGRNSKRAGQSQCIVIVTQCMKVNLIPPTIPEDEKSPLVEQLVAFIEQQGNIIQQQAEQIQQLKDEIARIKKQPPKPKIKPSSLEKKNVVMQKAQVNFLEKAPY